MSILFIIFIAVIVAFALFAGDAVVRTRQDIIIMRQGIADIRRKIDAATSEIPEPPRKGGQ
jgi:hypothetical protein